MSFKVLVTRRIPNPGLDLLARGGAEVVINPHDRPLAPDELLAMSDGCDGLISMLTDAIGEKFLELRPKIRAIANFAVGINNIDVAACTRRKIGVSNTPDVLTNATAEIAWCLIFACARRIVESDRLARSGEWTGWGPLQFLGVDIIGKTLGLIGAGRIGTQVALMSRGFDMPVLYFARRDNPELESRVNARRVSLEELLSKSDFVSIHTPLTPETRHLIGAPQLALMKSTAVLINAARGPVVDEAALIDALHARRIMAAGIDVYEFEPKIPAELRALDNVVVLPHIGSATIETRNKMSLMTAGDVLAMLHGNPPANPVNPVLWQ